MINIFIKGGFFIAIYSIIFVVSVVNASTQEGPSPVEINGDKVECFREDNKVIAEGNVVVVRGTTTLTCDRLEFFRETKMANAKGNVVLTTAQGTIFGDRMDYNFETMTGEFKEAKIITDPYYGIFPIISKLDENQMRGERGHMTTCDFEDPHYHMASKKVDIFPKEKINARNVRFVIGKAPIMFLPNYTHRLDDKRPRVTVIPGYSKAWGVYVLQRWKYYIREEFQGRIHLDYRERKDCAAGVDVKYQIPNRGDGIIRTYYINERNTKAKHFWKVRPEPTIEKERFKVDWRHKWTIDKQTEAILEYCRMSDADFLKDYFELEFEEYGNPDTYFLLTRKYTVGTLSFHVAARVNRFVSMVERFPEIRYSLSNQEIGETGIYFKTVDTYSNLTQKTANPSEVRQKTMRVDSNNELSYPMKIAFVEVRPFVGGQYTYYSRTKDPSEYDNLRGMFRTGTNVSTKFYRIFDVKENFMGIEINRLRHVITPSVDYDYKHDPTTESTKIDSFDSAIDSLQRAHSMIFSLENKLQTKRGGRSVDLLRVILSTNFLLKEDLGKGGFGTIESDVELKPNDWLKFYLDSAYNTKTDRLTSASFDVYINEDSEEWSFSLGKRYALDSEDLLTTEISYKINPKWKISFYEQFDIGSGKLKEQEYTITRDLHCWEVDFFFNETRGNGTELMLAFRMKAFPDDMLEFGTNLHKRKAGSQIFDQVDPPPEVKEPDSGDPET